ncbi:hypothetical protein ACFE04_003689 [Oxalis oulophora]
MMNNNRTTQQQQQQQPMPSSSSSLDENRYYGQGQTSESSSWTATGNTSYHQQIPLNNIQDGQNTSTTDYNAYANYPTSTMDPYAYANVTSTSTAGGYQGYTYPSYQQQQQQPNTSYPQQQQQQQPSNSYPQQPQQTVGAYQNSYQNTGASYQPLSSFENSGSYAGPASYSTTYYNPTTTDYQTSGGYSTNAYINHTTPSWNDASYAQHYASHQYHQSYTPDSTTTYASAPTATVSSVQHQQHYNQWSDYYSQTEVTCAPGTENLSVPSTSNLPGPPPIVNTIPTIQLGVSAGYPTSTVQPSPACTPSWNPESSASQMHSFQPGAAVVTHDSHWQDGALKSQNHHPGHGQAQYQKSVDSETPYDPFRDHQQTVCPPGSNYSHPTANEVPQSHLEPLQTLQSSDARRVTNMQIPTNHRVATNLAFSLSKSVKDGSTTNGSAKPAYLSVLMSKQNNAADSILKPGTFPKSLRGYVERALDRCKNDSEKAICQAAMKQVITKATSDGTLYTKDWDIEPLVSLSSPVALNNQSMFSINPLYRVPQDLNLGSSLPKFRKSPSRRTKSRWEPLPEEKPVNKLHSGHIDSVKFGGWHQASPKEKKPVNGDSESKGSSGNIKFPLVEFKSASKNAQRPAKKQRLPNGFKAAESGDVSSDSDKEQNLTAYYSGAIALAANSEEKKRREHRSKRFEKTQGHKGQANHLKPKNAGAGNLYTKRATALALSKSFEDGGTGSRAVEDMDWDSLTVKGTCQELEKRYLRLTSAPDPSTVRPEEILEKALVMVQNSQKNYIYKCDQLKSIRQDLTVQRIRNHLTAKNMSFVKVDILLIPVCFDPIQVYETHARLALESGDLPEYNQCQSQLKSLYAEGIEGCHMEFAAYNLLTVILHSSNNRELLSAMSRLSDEAKTNEGVKHALAVRAAVASGNYVVFFRLYKTAPNLNTCLMGQCFRNIILHHFIWLQLLPVVILKELYLITDLHVEKMRYKAVSWMARSYRPTVPVSYIARLLGFSDEDSDGVNECIEWLKAHGACLVPDNNGEMQLDAKVSSSSLFIPEPDDAVAHGDANLAVNDFLANSIMEVRLHITVAIKLLVRVSYDRRQ